MQNDRGKIHTPDRAAQLRDFSGLLFGTITPTDIDGLIEYHNLGYIFMEFKFADTHLPSGQRLALERLTDSLKHSGKPTLCIIATHCQINVNLPIDTANCEVTEYRFNGKWQKPNQNLNVKELATKFIKYLNDKTPSKLS